MKNIIDNATKYFPTLKIKYKDSSFFMKLLSYILFFNKVFMTKYTTTIGPTIYFPSEAFIKLRPISSLNILLHELTHINDSMKFGTFLYSFLYLFPISLFPFMLLFLIFSWKIALILIILCMLPLPAYFRMHFERRAYFVSLYVINSLSKKMDFNPFLEDNKKYFISQFKAPAYYFMWVFPNINKQFDEAVKKIKADKRPFEDSFFDIIDELISQIEISQS
jgi:ABC-type multidrug transport system fused ATPase/permease subunit